MIGGAQFPEQKENVIHVAPMEEEPVAAPGLVSRIYTVVSNILSSIAEYIVPYTDPVDENRAYAAGVLANANGPRFNSPDRYVFALSQADDDAYTDVLTHSVIVPELKGRFIPDMPVFEFRTPNICHTGDSIIPEIPHAPLINWFLSKKNIRQLQKVALEDQAPSLAQFLKLQFLKDFTRRRFDGDKTYVIDGILKDSRAIITSLADLDTDEAKAEYILHCLFGQRFVKARSAEVLPILALMCQNSGITAHAMIEAHERGLNPKLDVVCLDLTQQQDHFMLTTEKDQSITYCYTFHAPYRFIDSDGGQQLKLAKVVFSVNLKADEDELSSPPKILYSYLVKDFISTSS